MDKEKDILEYMRKKIGLFYLSDLKFIDFDKMNKLCELIVEIDDSAFPLSEWQEAVSYISNERREFENIKLCKQYLCLYYKSVFNYYKNYTDLIKNRKETYGKYSKL